MINEKMLALGEARSDIRELYEYGKVLAKSIGEENVFDFSLGNPSAQPPDCLTESLSALLNKKGIHGYTSAQGDFTARQKIANYTNETFDLNLTPDDVYLTVGAAAGLAISLRALCNCGEEVVVLAPYFPEYKVFAQSCGGVLQVCKPNDDFSISIKELSLCINKNTACVIINSPNNPSGRVYDKDEIIALTNLLKEKQQEYDKPIYLISDEPYREITYGKPFVNPMNYYPNTITCYSFSKSLSLAGERIGYVAVSPSATNAKRVYHAICGAGRALGYVCAPALFQHAVTDCLGKTADLTPYETNRSLLYNALVDLGFECAPPDGAFYLFVKCPIEQKRFIELCKSEGLLLVPSASFGVEGYVRISYCVEKDRITRALPHFKNVASKCGLIKE